MRHKPSNVRLILSVVATFAAVVTSSCRKQRHPNTIKHPNPNAIVRELEPAFTIRKTQRNPLDRATTDVDRWVANLRALRPSVSIGVFDGTAAEMFGRIDDAVLLSDGVIVILDSRTPNLRMYDTAGRFLAVAGRGGRGPGEFQSPTALAVDVQDRLFVGDRFALHVYHRSADTLAYERTVQLSLSVRDLCFLSDRLYVHGMDSKDPGKVVHHVDANGAIVNSFGEVYRVTDSPIALSMRRGRIACLEDMETVVLAPSYVPELHAWHGDGTAAWVVNMPDWQTFDITQTRSPLSLAIVIPEEGAHYPHHLVPLGRGVFVLDLAFRTRRSLAGKEEYSTIDRYVINATRHEASYVGIVESPLLAADSATVVFATETPVPQLHIAKIGAGR